MNEPLPKPPPRRGPPRRIEVRRIDPLSPQMVRITFGGDDLASLEWRGPAGHLKLVVPGDGEHEAAMPQADGPRPANMRTYTPRAFRAEAAELDIDFVLHAHGPAGRWATRAAVGDRLVMLGPAPGYVIDAEAAWFLLIGDDTALPAIETLLEGLPEAVKPHTRALIEVTSDAERRPLPAAGTAQIEWLPRGDDHHAAGRALEAALRAMPGLPAGSGRIYIGCEAAAMRRLRALLIDALGADRSRIVNRGYWKLGAVNHPDHDFGDDAG